MEPHRYTRSSPWWSTRTWLTLLIATALVSCGSIPQAAAHDRRGKPPTNSTLQAISRFDSQSFDISDPTLTLVGTADFDADDLDEVQRLWYERLWRAVDASIDDQVASAEEDNAYTAGRTIFLFNHTLLAGLRTTGDLAFLDAVDEVAQAMRAQLSDSWCGGVANSVDVNVRYGTVRSPDGFLNFRLRRGSDIHYCRDTGDLNETLTHGHLALVMYAYHVNRDNPSPGGIDYGERADFWLDYLRNHFEAKWRQRSNTAWPDMDFIDLKFCHTYHQMLMYYTYLGLRLHSDGDPAADVYLRQSMRLTDGVFNVPYRAGQQPGGFIDVDTPLGEAVVYSFGAPGSSDTPETHLEACPVTYARYMLSSVLNLRLDAVAGWDDGIMQRIATGLAYFVVDTEPLTDKPRPFAAGVSGEETVRALPPTEYRDRVTIDRFAATPFAAWSVWDASRTLERSALEVYDAVEADSDDPRSVHLPAGMLLVATLQALAIE